MGQSTQAKNPTVEVKNQAEKNVDVAADAARRNAQLTAEMTQRFAPVVVDSYEKTLKSYADFHERVGRIPNVEAVSTVASAQASLVRDIAEITASANRDLLK